MPRGRERVDEGEPSAVQELTVEAVRARAPVTPITGYRMTDRGEVRADLVRSARLEPHVDQRVGGQELTCLEVCARFPGSPAAHGSPLGSAVVAA